MNYEKHLFKVVVTISILTSPIAFSAQDVYEYKNKAEVTEFTDQKNNNAKLQKHIQIDKTTAEQEARSEEKLQQIIKNDQQLDKQIAEKKKLEDEQKQLRKEASKEKSKQQSSDNNDRNDNGYYYSTPRHLINRHDLKNPGEKPARPVKPVGPVNPVRSVRPIGR